MRGAEAINGLVAKDFADQREVMFIEFAGAIGLRPPFRGTLEKQRSSDYDAFMRGGGADRLLKLTAGRR